MADSKEDELFQKTVQRMLRTPPKHHDDMKLGKRKPLKKKAVKKKAPKK